MQGCIDQSNIAEALALLPIFLSGCQRLLVVAGRTYTERLWCIMEIFIFLEMGGKISNVDIKPIHGTAAELAQLFASFDVQEAKCFLLEDRSRLLAVIEAAYGSFDLFNEHVRSLMLEACPLPKSSVGPARLQRQQSSVGRVLNVARDMLGRRATL